MADEITHQTHIHPISGNFWLTLLIKKTGEKNKKREEEKKDGG